MNKGKEPVYQYGKGDRYVAWRCECGYKNKGYESELRVCLSCGKVQGESNNNSEAVHIGTIGGE